MGREERSEGDLISKEGIEREEEREIISSSPLTNKYFSLFSFRVISSNAFSLSFSVYFIF